MNSQAAPGAPAGSGAVLAVCALWWATVVLLAGGGAPSLLNDAWEYALFARHLFEGDGLRTHAIHPPLWPLHDARLTVPMLVHGPLLPALLAPLHAVSPDAAVAALPWIAGGFAAFAGALLHRAASRKIDRSSALLAVFLFTTSPLAVHVVLADPSFAAGACAGALALERMFARRHFAAGFACGVGALVRPEFVLIAPLLALAVRGARVRLLGGFAIAWLPWAWHQTAASGVPAFNLSAYLLLAFTRTYPELSVLRAFDLPIERWQAALVRELPALWDKWLHAAPRALKHLLTAPGVATGWLAVVALAGLRRGMPDPLRPHAGIVLAMAVPLALMVGAQHRPEFVMTLLPLWTLLAVLGLRGLAGARFETRTRWIFLLVAALSIPGTWISIARESESAAAWRGWIVRERQALVARFGQGPSRGPGDVVLTDSPGFVAWATGRTTIWVTREEFLRSRQGGAGIPGEWRGAATWFHADPRVPGPPGGPADASP